MKELPVESVFKILTSNSISHLVRALHGLLSSSIPLKHTSIGIFSPSGDSLLVAGSTDEEVETAALVPIGRNEALMRLLHDREPVLLRPFNHDIPLGNLRDADPNLPPGNIIIPMEVENTVLGVLMLLGESSLSYMEEDRLEMIGDISITATHAVVSIHEKDSYKMEQDRLRSEVESLGDDYLEAKFYSELFMNNPDGMLVMDFVGRILHVNPAADALLCKDANPLPENFSELLEEEDLAKFNLLLEGFQQGIYPKNWEAVIVLPFGKRCILAISISLVPQREGYILLSLRDVTEQRTMERQLAEAKAFQERIFNSSVDAIIAADMDGTIVLFNDAAARLTRWSADEVIGIKNVKDLYPQRQGRDILNKLRGDDYGGKGKMEPQKVWLISKEGENIPVSLSAAIIYDGEKESYTCGIFSDLREKLRSQEKIAFISERLQQSEKQAELAELAGTMAHELNQPLTSIYGCGELLLRRLSEDKSYQRYVKIILDEATRMTDIIKKIGKITKYETQTYMGKAKILDLDKSAARASDPPPAPSGDGKEQT
jgi:PAS domain S-box-containing protein